MDVKFVLVSVILVVYLSICVGFSIKLFLYKTNPLLIISTPFITLMSFIFIPISVIKTVLSELDEIEAITNKALKQEIDKSIPYIKLSKFFRMKVVFEFLLKAIKHFPGYVDSLARSFSNISITTKTYKLLKNPYIPTRGVLTLLARERFLVKERIEKELRNVY